MASPVLERGFVMDTVKVANKKNVKMVAHRGVSGLERENTSAQEICLLLLYK